MKLTDALRDRLRAYRINGEEGHTANPDDPHANALIEAGYIQELEDGEAASNGQKRHTITEAGEAALNGPETDSNT